MKKIYLLILFFIGFSFLNAQCTVNDATDCECEDPTQVDCDLLPDIQVSWFGLIDVSDGPTEYPQEGAGENNGRLRISVSTPNNGYGPLTVRGVDSNGYAYFICGNDTIQISSDELGVNGGLSGYYCDNSDEPAKQITFQRIYHRNADGTMSYYDRMAGSMTYHPTHGHMHSDEWGVFTLRKMDENEPNPLNWPIVSDGAKMGFCLMDYGTCGTNNNSTYADHCKDENRYSPSYLDYFPELNDGSNGGTTLYNNDFPNFGLGGGNYGCSPIEQGISSGYLDLYGEWLDEQWINIDPGLCNGTYWIVGEVDRLDFYLESNEDNNWTAIPVTLTQQLDGGGYDIEILSPDEVNLCNGEITTLTSTASPDSEFMWSTGEITSTIEVSETGQYSVTTINSCGEGESQIVSVNVNEEVESPIIDDLTVETGEYAILEATGTGNIIWQDINGNILQEGSTFISSPLFQDTTFYVVNEEVISIAPETLPAGALEHECDGSTNCNYSGTIYNGGLRFNALSDFTLNSVRVYTDTEGIREIELQDENGNVLNSLTINIPTTNNDGYEVDLNFSIIEGNNYILTTNTNINNNNFGDNNPLLKRTTGGLPNFPYVLDNIIEITDGYYNDSNDSFGFSENYYYYFYDWKINNEWEIGGKSCLSDVTEVNVTINQGIGLDELDIMNNNIIFDVFGRKWPNFKSLPNGFFIQNNKKYVKIK